MNEQSQNEQPLEDRQGGNVPPAPGERPPEVPPTSRLKLFLNIAGGFLAWYLVNAFIYSLVSGQETLVLCSGALFPANVVVLILLLRKLPGIGWGMLSALGVNLLISLVLGLTLNAFCFVPFFSGGR